MITRSKLVHSTEKCFRISSKQEYQIIVGIWFSFYFTLKSGILDFEPLNATLMNYLYIDSDNETGLKPHMENGYEHEVGEKFRAL